jgi:hypothetical protein
MLAKKHSMTMLVPDSRQLDVFASLCVRIIDSDLEQGKTLLQLRPWSQIRP